MWYCVDTKKTVRKRNRQTKNKKVGEDMLEQRDLEMIGELIRKENKEIKQEIGGMKQDIKELKENQKRFDRELKAINVTLENEVIKSIKIIAEGHLDLSRKLDEALKFEKEREMTNLQLVQMQGEIARLKIKVNGQ